MTTANLIPNINNKNVEAIAFPVLYPDLVDNVFPLSHSLKCIHNRAKTFFQCNTCSSCNVYSRSGG